MGLDLQTRKNLEKELVKNTDVLENIFTSYNLKFMDIAYSSSSDGSVTTYVEFTTLDGSPTIKCEGDCIFFKMNFYNNNKLLHSTYACYSIANFRGYDTEGITCNYNDLIEDATSARLFITD